MNKTLKNGLIVIIILFAVSFIYNLGTANRNFEPSQEAIDNTSLNAFKISFVEGCTEEGAKEPACSCAFDALTTYYGSKQWYKDTATLNRIVNDGYNYAEAKAMSKCGSANPGA